MNYTNWAQKYDEKVSNLITKYKEETISFLNIERETKKPRKDYENYSSIFPKSWYMYDEEFKDLTYHFNKITDKEEIINIMSTYLNDYYNLSDTQDEWFNKIKELGTKMNYASDMKEYKENPEAYKGNIADFTTVMRVSLTTLDMTPNLYDIMKILGKDRMLKRLEILKENY